MSTVTEVRWHARAGQGAKTAAQVLALALLRSGKNVQAFPEYGPERRGAPLRAFTRISDAPIRRHDAITNPDLVVVLEPSLVHETDVTEGLPEDGLIILNARSVPAELEGRNVRCIRAGDLAAAHASGFSNLVMLGAAAASLGEPTLQDLEAAVADQLARKTSPDDACAAVREGYECLS
jgi:pyruvate ferredoxin oxidoreductase gamma subunit